MTDAFHKLPLTFDIQRLKQDLWMQQQQLWIEHINRHVHDGGWASLPLRSVDGRIDNANVVETNPAYYKNTPYLEQSSYLKEVLASFQCTIVSARLMSLQARQEIRRHTDLDLRFEDGCARLHIPIQTHPAVEFNINDQSIHFGEGECWYMNANYPHQVFNGSDINRVHLVIDCVVNDWLRALFSNSGYQTKISDHKYGCANVDDNNVSQVIAQLECLGSETALALAHHYKTIKG
ncbi:L-proline cis-4-hydroxylase [Marinomonas aquimarina]|uniref:L-proline cis-4-hydroxylase n=1 Tax=Marinomonas aquimarina TaxID=295068 RepID=A0A1A8TH47_9GAMM|nr:aspartyl/asparaginyl beta-hydroxylase domain-containing protein [Marinomonas aquimarina]SBS31363.1 L-proline cis-4-hydroxylase [Marinomonas aquimarina]